MRTGQKRSFMEIWTETWKQHPLIWKSFCSQVQWKRHRCLVGSRLPLLSWVPCPFRLSNCQSCWPTANSDLLPGVWPCTCKAGSYTEATAAHRPLNRLSLLTWLLWWAGDPSDSLTLLVNLHFPSSSWSCVNSNPVTGKPGFEIHSLRSKLGTRKLPRLS